MTKKSFKCRFMKRHLGKGGKEIYGISGIKKFDPKTPIRRRDMCLVCGDLVDGKFDNMFCTKTECEFGAHLECLEAHVMVMGISMYEDDTFTCSDIKYQFRRYEVLMHSTLDVISVSKLTKIATKRGMVNSAKYSNQCKRWENDEIQCPDCNKWIDLYEKNHASCFCPAADGEPISDRNINYPFACIKRFKHITLKVP